MNKSRKIVITLIIVLLILLIGVGGAFAYAYLKTDIFKSDRELFFKYLSQISAEENGFIESNIAKFQEKKKQNIYENSGEITVETQIPEEVSDKIINKVNELIIRFSGKSNATSRKAEQNIEIDYGNDVIFPINYRQDGDIIGLQTKYVGSKYIAVENNNLKEFAEKFGIESTEIPNKIEIKENVEKLKFTPEELEQIKQIYSNVINEQLSNENFSSAETSEGINYILTLSGEQLKNVTIKLLETFKQDTILLNKINKYMEEINQGDEYTRIDATAIQETIDDLQEKEATEFKDLKITVSQNNKMLNKIIIEYDTSKISIAKNIENEQLIYQIEIQNISEEDGNININLNCIYKGLQNLDNVEENYEFGYSIEEDDETMSYKLNYSNVVQFKEMAQIDGFNEENAIILNDYDNAAIQNLVTKIGERLVQVNKMQMEKLGLEESENPLLYANPVTLFSVMVYNKAQETINNDLAEAEKQAFNDKYIRYEGEAKKGTHVNALVQEVLNNNIMYQDDESKIINVVKDGVIFLDGTENSIPYKVPTANTFTIKMFYSEDGFINKIQITTEE